MDAVRNPFAPGAGTPPPELAGRGDIIARAETTFARVREARPSKSFLFVGLRGVGKTVLLNRMNEIAETQGYKAVFVEGNENKALAALLYPYLRQLLLALDRMEQLNEHVKRGLSPHSPDDALSFGWPARFRYSNQQLILDCARR